MSRFKLFASLFFLTSLWCHAQATSSLSLEMTYKTQQHHFHSETNSWTSKDIEVSAYLQSGTLKIIDHIHKIYLTVPCPSCDEILSQAATFIDVPYLHFVKKSNEDYCMGHSPKTKPQDLVLTIIKNNEERIILDNSGFCRNEETVVIQPLEEKHLQDLWKLEEKIKNIIYLKVL